MCVCVCVSLCVRIHFFVFIHKSCLCYYIVLFVFWGKYSGIIIEFFCHFDLHYYFGYSWSQQYWLLSGESFVWSLVHLSSWNSRAFLDVINVLPLCILVQKKLNQLIFLLLVGSMHSWKKHMAWILWIFFFHFVCYLFKLFRPSSNIKSDSYKWKPRLLNLWREEW